MGRQLVRSDGLRKYQGAWPSHPRLRPMGGSWEAGFAGNNLERKRRRPTIGQPGSAPFCPKGCFGPHRLPLPAPLVDFSQNGPDVSTWSPDGVGTGSTLDQSGSSHELSWRRAARMVRTWSHPRGPSSSGVGGAPSPSVSSRQQPHSNPAPSGGIKHRGNSFASSPGANSKQLPLLA